MTLFGFTVAELISLLGLVGLAVTAWFNLRNKTDINTKSITEIEADMKILVAKVAEQEKQTSVVTSQLATIQGQMTNISSRLDTILSYLLSLKEK